MHFLALGLLALCILFRREMRILFIAAMLLLLAATWTTVSFWSERYDHWDACGRRTTGICAR